MTKLSNKVIVITGSTQGIGKAIADACGKAGAKLVICSRNNEHVNEALRYFKEKNYPVSGMVADVSQTEDLKKLKDHALEQWGHFDVWINNAGVSTGYRLLEHVPDEDLRKIVDINLTATLLACKMIIPYFKQQGSGILINMSGRGGHGDHAAFMVPYTATKAAITTLTQSLAKENADHPLSIHSVVPGMIDTGFFDSVETDEAGRRDMKSLPWVMQAFGFSPEEVGHFFVRIVAQQPGKKTGHNYSMLKGFRLLRGILMISWFKIRGKI
ncbi:MAG: SDR family oxidoreductase [Bacteroidales bacterium]|nr:SDR family oxidoreductase [Bacteroidales bacterium]